jgi:hypothetical protein
MFIISEAQAKLEKNENDGTSDIILDGAILSEVNSICYVGVQIDRHLLWEDHIKGVCRRMYHGISQINRAKRGLSTPQRKALYHAFVEPHFDYCSAVWSPATKKSREKVAVVQRVALQALTDYKLSVSGDDLFRKWKITPVFERWRQAEAIWMFKIKNPKLAKTPKYVCDLVTIQQSVYKLRCPRRVETSRANVKAGETTLAARLRSLFVLLPEAVWNALSVSHFRTVLSHFNLFELTEKRRAILC